MVNNIPVDFLIDTSAEVTLVSQSVHRALGSPPLKVTSRNLKGPSNDRLLVKGWFRGKVQNKPDEQGVKQDIYVVDRLSRCLLGQPAIKTLDLVVRVRGVTDSSKEVVRDFSQLFRGLGKFNSEYTIQLEEGAKPFALTTPRRVPIPMMKAVKKELERMEELGIGLHLC